MSTWQRMPGARANLASAETSGHVRGERRMAAREDQAKLIVLDAFRVRPRSSVDHRDIDGVAVVVLERVEALAAAHRINGLEPPG